MLNLTKLGQTWLNLGKLVKTWIKLAKLCKTQTNMAKLGKLGKTWLNYLFLSVPVHFYTFLSVFVCFCQFLSVSFQMAVSICLLYWCISSKYDWIFPKYDWISLKYDWNWLNGFDIYLSTIWVRYNQVSWSSLNYKLLKNPILCTCIFNRHSQKCVTLLKLRTELKTNFSILGLIF